MINHSLIKERISEIRQAIEGLKSLAALEKNEFLGDLNWCDSAKYKLIVAIEAAISICNHIAARKFKKAPESYADCFLMLGDLKVISKELSEKLSNMAKFRNMLVHIYWQIDNEKVYEILNNNLIDLEDYIKELKKFIQNNSL